METESSLGISLGAEAEYLRGVESSTCLLLAASPSPTPPDAPLEHPLADAAFAPSDVDACTVRLQSPDDLLGGDSSSSGDSASVVQDPVSAQLINNISMMDYHTLSKGNDLIIQQDVDRKLNGSMSLGNQKLPNFVNWNWTMVRKVLLWIVVSALIACSAVIVAMIATLPKVCNPDLPWHQGKVFYEIFPASFANSNNDIFGDLQGVTKNLDYIQDLGVSVIRLNYIFEATKYPEHYTDTTNLTSIDRHIGSLNDFQELVAEVHKKNMSILLDIPVTSMGKIVTVPTGAAEFNRSAVQHNYVVDSADPLTQAITYWSTTQHVDGFYLKGLENFVADPNFESNLQHWKRIIGYDKIFIVSEETFKRTTGTARSVLLSRVDLVDVHLDAGSNVTALKQHITDVVTGPLWSKASNPWVHWNLGDVGSQRLSSLKPRDALALLMLELSLPGTVSIFYGDEIGLPGIQGKESDFHEHEQIHNLVSMKWKHDRNRGSLAWNSNLDAEQPRFDYLDIVKPLIQLRMNTPTLYMNLYIKDNKLNGNTGVKETEESDAVVVERWLPRRNSYVLLANLRERTLAADMTSSFYAGTVLAATNRTAVDSYLYFQHLALPPHGAMLVKLEK